MLPFLNWEDEKDVNFGRFWNLVKFWVMGFVGRMSGFGGGGKRMKFAATIAMSRTVGSLVL